LAVSATIGSPEEFWSDVWDFCGVIASKRGGSDAAKGGAKAVELHPYLHLTEWTLLEDVGQFFRTYYAPNNATLSIVGDFQRDSVKTLYSHCPAVTSVPV
jgi:hypothetical protein